MLTVKHIDTDGSERLYEAETIKVVAGKGIGEDGIFLDPVESRDLGQRINGHVPQTFKHVIHYASARSIDDTTPMAFVMNRFGATVATYRL